MDKVKRFGGGSERFPIDLGVTSLEVAVRGYGFRLWEGDVEAEDSGVGVLGCEGEGPDAGAAADVEDTKGLVGGWG